MRISADELKRQNELIKEKFQTLVNTAMETIADDEQFIPTARSIAIHSALVDEMLQTPTSCLSALLISLGLGVLETAVNEKKIKELQVLESN